MITVSSRFNSLGCWADTLNAFAGPGSWYLAGGCAAFLHIDSYSDKDAADYAASRMQIFPTSIEIGMEETRAAAALARFGRMEVCLSGFWLEVIIFALPPAVLEQQRSRCAVYGFPPNASALVYTPENLLRAYTAASGSGEPKPRQLRVAMLRLMMQRGHIDRFAIEFLAQEPASGASAG